MTKEVHGELKALLEQRLVAKYGSLDNVQNTPEVRDVIHETAKDYLRMLEERDAREWLRPPSVNVNVRVDAGASVVHITSHAVELRKPRRKVAKKKCKVVDLTAWRLARGR
jgi:hypothetical protein